MFNIKIIVYTLGLLLVFNGAFMVFPALLSWYLNEPDTINVLLAVVIIFLTGFSLMFFTREHDKDIQKKDGYIIVTLGWIFMALSGTLPYITTGYITSFSDAFFETMSGFTTTGATILNDIERLPQSILLWRSLTHWIGGMGIIVLTVAILPLFGIGGMQLFAAESPGPSADKLKPRIADTAKRLWLIYVSFTAIETILLKIAGMNWLNAINHSLSTLSTGGFSTKNESIAYWNDQPMIQYIILFFMFLAGANFVVSYFAIKGNFNRVKENEEFRWYASFILIFSLITAIIIFFQVDLSLNSVTHPIVISELESVIRHSLFQVLAVITTTGFVTSDFTLWTPFLTILFFSFYFLGGSAGSTSGGVKVVRHIVMIKNAFFEFKRTLHPNAIIPVRYKGKGVDEKIIFNILGFFILYALSFMIGAIVLAANGLDFETAIGGAASCLGNVGPAFGDLSPVDNYGSLPDFSKIWMTFLMLIGRLELFTVLILFSPFFWKN
ncbi:MAG: TrkH family potassium uptake protein [Psychroflexus sp.]|nr:TrkH family potassium uptake protein [Psychroflexus sp.]MDR9447737.1 TrkH family potassium uptake protein [Psychroflexus sp.]